MFGVNTMGNDHSCKSLTFNSKSQSVPSAKKNIDFKNHNFPLLKELNNVPTPLTEPGINDKGASVLKINKRIFDYENMEFQYDDNDLRIMPLAIIHTGAKNIKESIELFAYNYNEKQGEISKELNKDFPVSAEELFNIRKKEDVKKFENHSYFEWQFGRELDEKFNIKQYKGQDCPVFISYFRDSNEPYTDFTDLIGIECIATWNEKMVAFMMCENAMVDEKAVHAFGYFGAIKSFKEARFNDIKGNFVSFGNNLTLNGEKYAILPPEDSENRHIPEEELIGNNVTIDAYALEGFLGAPYIGYTVGSYSEFEFTEKSPLDVGKSAYVGKSAVSKIVLGQSHENERGYLDRVYVTTKYGKHFKKISTMNKTELTKEKDYIYIDLRSSAISVFANSNRVIRGVYFLMEDD